MKKIILNNSQNNEGYRGENSLDTLINFCDLERTDFRTYTIPHPEENPESVCERILKLISSQPALVSNFKVDLNFLFSDDVSFSGKFDDIILLFYVFLGFISYTDV